MNHPVTGSVGVKSQVGPFDESKVWAMHFIQGMVTLNTMNEMAERITTIEAMLDLPMIHSASTPAALRKKIDFDRELKEIEEALMLLCALTDVPEA